MRDQPLVEHQEDAKAFEEIRVATVDGERAGDDILDVASCPAVLTEGARVLDDYRKAGRLSKALRQVTFPCA